MTDTANRAEVIGEQGDAIGYLIARRVLVSLNGSHVWIANFSLGESRLIVEVSELSLEIAGVKCSTGTPFMAEVALKATNPDDVHPTNIRRIDEV